MQVESLESRRLFAAGFASGTSVVVPLIGSPLRASAEPRQLLTGSEGSIYTVTFAAGVGTQVRRVTPAGKLDSAFGRKGRLTFPGADAKVAIDGYDRLYVLKGRQVTRYSAAGQLDTSYTGDGTTTLGGFTQVNDILIDRQDRLWAVGTRSETITTLYHNSTQSYAVTAFTVARVTSRGLYDTKFDGDGIYAPDITGIAGLDRRSAGLKLRLLGDGSVIAAGIGDYDATFASGDATGTLAVVETAKFGPNGKRDLSYGHRGRAVFLQSHTADGSSGVTLQGIQASGVTVVKQTVSGVSGTDTRFRQITAAGVSSNASPEGVLPSDLPVITARADGYTVVAETTPLPNDLGDVGPSSSITLKTDYPISLPRVTATGRNITTAANSVRFNVFYSATSLQPSTIDGDEILVRNAAGQYRAARLFSVIEQSDGRYRAEYRVGNPDGSSGFTRADNGPLIIIVRAGGATDTDGNGNVTATIGNINVKIR